MPTVKSLRLQCARWRRFRRFAREFRHCRDVATAVGLGRYGDPIDPDGDLKAMRELQRVVAPAGALLFVAPVGEPRIQINAHHIYSYQQVCEAFSKLELVQFALVPDRESDGGLLEDAAPDLVQHQRYACVCFWFRRPGPCTAADGSLR